MKSSQNFCPKMLREKMSVGARANEFSGEKSKYFTFFMGKLQLLSNLIEPDMEAN
jgi:hypothetical protein